MKRFLKILKWTGLGLLVLLLAFFSFVQLSWKKKFEAPYPDIQASKDSALIERGKYLAYGPAHCGTCHVPMDKIMDVEGGEIIPLSGGWELSIPPGTFRAPNLTPDVETGIGKLTDAEIARTMRHMVGSDNRCIMPFMPFAELSDEDLTAVISYLRSQPAVRHEVKRSEFTFLGKAVMALGMIKPQGTTGHPPKSVQADTSMAYGEYLANYVANCVGCHTARDMKTGKFTGEPFAGGLLFMPDNFSNGRAFVSPNLTPDKATGLIVDWDEAQFLDRFSKGRIHKGSPMPWGSFSRITENDLKAIFRYLKSLQPVNNEIAKIVFEPGEPLPE